MLFFLIQAIGETQGLSEIQNPILVLIIALLSARCSGQTT